MVFFFYCFKDIQMNQDLKYAAEAIQRIADQAIRSIENLYSQQTQPIFHQPQQQPVTQQPAQFADYPEPNYNIQQAPARQGTTNTFEIPKRDRPQNIDSNLQNILL